jgi:hypothetical protein
MADESSNQQRSLETEQTEMLFIRGMQMGFVVFGAGFELIRKFADEWTTRNQAHIQEAFAKLNHAVRLETPELRTNAVTDVVSGGFKAALEDFITAGYKAMTYAGAYAQKTRDEWAMQQYQTDQDPPPTSEHRVEY